ncbi:MAG: hypothetical protein AAGG08_18270, partial [Actinomycetota bacterium]
MTDDQTREIRRSTSMLRDPGPATSMTSDRRGTTAESAASGADQGDADKDWSEPIKKPKKAWWHRHLDSEERQRIMTELGIRKQQHWEFRFFTMITLSV